MANRRPQPGDKAMILPDSADPKGSEYLGTACDVLQENWEPHEFLQMLDRLAERLGQEMPEPTWDRNKPFWDVRAYDGNTILVHEGCLEPIDPEAEKTETSNTAHEGA